MTSVVRELYERLRQPEEMVVFVLGLMLVKRIDQPLFVEALNVFNPLIPHLLPLLKLFSLLMAFGGIAGIVLTLLCWVLETMYSINKNRVSLGNPPAPPAWYLRTVNGITYGSFCWMWISLGLIYLLGGLHEIPRFFQNALPPWPSESASLVNFFKMLIASITILTLVGLLFKTITHFVTPVLGNRVVDVRIAEPFSVHRIEKPITVNNPEKSYERPPGFHATR